MNTDALILMIVTQGLATILAFYFIIRTITNDKKK
jgi:hypothetical protein